MAVLVKRARVGLDAEVVGDVGREQLPEGPRPADVVLPEPRL